MTTLDAFAAQIIKGQEFVIGPLAWSVAGKVQGITVDPHKKEVIISDADPKSAIDRLVAQYERLFGSVSREVCKDAVKDLIKNLPPSDIPSSLRATA